VGVAVGLRRLRARTAEEPAVKSLVALMGAAVFAISLMPIPVPVAGSVSHPAGTPLAAIVVGPAASVLLAGISLLIQALFFAHGGLTTLGANIMSEGIVGSFAGYFAFRLSRRAGASLFWAGFLAGILGDLAVYMTTAIELGLGLFPLDGAARGAGALFLAFLPTQGPLAVLEGIFTGGVLSSLAELRPDILSGLGLGEGRARRVGTPRVGVRHRLRHGGRGLRIAALALAVVVGVVAIGGLVWAIAVTTGTWVGIDAGVMERVAEEQGRAAWTPFINTDVGDLLLFVFFLGAVVAGAVIGWVVHGLRSGGAGAPVRFAEGGLTRSPRRRRRGRVVALAGAGAVACLVLWAWFVPGFALGPVDGHSLRTLGEVLAHPSRRQVLSARGGDAVLFAFMLTGLLGGLVVGWRMWSRFAGRRPRFRLPHLHTSHDVGTGDRYAWRAMGPAAVDARIKIAVLAAILGANLLAGWAFSAVLLALCLGAMTLVVRVRWVAVLLRMAPALMMGVMLVVLRGLTLPGRPVVSIDLPLLAPFAVSLEGLAAGAELAVVVLAGVSLLLLLGLSTPLPALLSALRWYRVPGLLIDIGMLMYRYLFLFVEETQRMRQAQRLRGPEVPWRRAMGGFNSMGANLLIRSYDRSQRVYDAQRLRGGERRP
jgi:cobalt/nickel transport system permease protein